MIINLENINISNNVYYKMNHEYFMELLELIKHGHCTQHLLCKCSKKTYRDYSHLKQWIDCIIPSVINNSQYDYNTRIHWILFNRTDFPICPICKSSENFKNKNVQIFKGYTECCCKACAVKNPVRCKKISETHLRRSKEDPEYWNRRYEKSKCTNIAKYGVENVSQSEEIKNKKIATFQKHYNVQYGFQSKEVIDKIERTMVEKYGVKHILQSETYKNAFKQTCINRFGVDHPMHNDIIRRKTRKGYYYDNVFFDSSWELCMYIYLKDNNIDFTYQPKDCDFEYSFDNSIHKYFPDFKIGEEYVELKGDHMIDKHSGCWIPPPYVKIKYSPEQYKYECNRVCAKYKCAMANSVKVLTQKDCQMYIQHVKIKYGTDYIKQFKVSSFQTEHQK